ncbi:MAG: SMP-30/gluconolactonase/LRE family protein [Dehalococcoidia bacterium]
MSDRRGGRLLALLLPLTVVAAAGLTAPRPGVAWRRGCNRCLPAARSVRTVVTFPDVPEGITSDGYNLYVSLFDRDEIWRLDPYTGDAANVASVPGDGAAGTLSGLEFNPRDGTVYAAFKAASGVDLFTPDHADCRDAADVETGIYRWDPADGIVEPFATRGSGVPLCNPDDIAFDAAGDAYVSDLALGLIWRFDPQGRGGVWSDDPLLGWTEQTATWNDAIGAEAGYVGVNTIAFSPDGRYLYAGTDGGPGWSTGAGLLVRVPVNDDGSAAPAELLASGLGCNDGLETAPDGTIYFADTCNSDIWAFAPDASRRLLVASRNYYGDPLDNATSLVLLNGCLYNTELGYFELQQGRADEAARSVVEICDLENPLTSADASYNPPARPRLPPAEPRPPAARPLHPAPVQRSTQPRQ